MECHKKLNEKGCLIGGRLFDTFNNTMSCSHVHLEYVVMPREGGKEWQPVDGVTDDEDTKISRQDMAALRWGRCSKVYSAVDPDKALQCCLLPEHDWPSSFVETSSRLSSDGAGRLRRTQCRSNTSRAEDTQELKSLKSVRDHRGERTDVESL